MSEEGDGTGEIVFDERCETVRLEIRRARASVGAHTWTQFCVRENDGRDGVVIVADHARCFLLVRQYRPAIAAWSWEFPRGMGEDRDPLVDAERELREETGLVAASVRLIGFVYPNTGLLNTRVAVISAQIADIRPKSKPDGEVVELRWVDAAALSAQIACGELTDGLSLAALTLRNALGPAI